MPRIKNPTVGTVIVTLGMIGIVAAAGGGIAYYVINEGKKKKEKKAKKGKKRGPLPPPPEPEDEGGIFFTDDCSDFFIVEPEGDGKNHPQMVLLNDIIQTSVTKQAKQDAVSPTLDLIDPWVLAADYLEQISPETCEFPPSAEAPPRIIQLYLFMTTMVAVLVTVRGGKLDGIANGGEIDARLAEQGAERFGYPPLNPEIVPDLFPQGADEGTLDGEGGEATFTFLEPEVTSIEPTGFVASSAAQDIVLTGSFTPGVKIKAFDEAKLQEADKAEFIWQGGKNQAILRIIAKRPGTYQLFIRLTDGAPWEPTGVFVESRLAQATFSG